MVTQPSSGTNGPLRENSLTLVGAPLIEGFAPLEGTPAARFGVWLPDNEARIHRTLHDLTMRWNLIGSFVVVRFLHPTRGPAGAIALSATTLDTAALHHRLKRVTVIPLTDLGPYVPRWERGETVVVEVSDMPSDLARRYAATPVRWSANVPVMNEGKWVGIVGAVAGVEGFPARTVAALEALGEWMQWEFEADTAWAEFVASTEQEETIEGEHGNRLLRLLR